MKAKVIHFLYSGGYSGAEKVVIFIMKNTSVRYNNYYASPSGQINDVLRKNNLKHILVKKINIITMLKVIRKNKPDIIHLNDYHTSIIGAILKLLGLTGGARIIAHIHKCDNRMQKKTLLFYIFRFCVPYFDSIIVVSKNVIYDSMLKNVIGRKATIINNVVDSTSVLKKSELFQVPPFDIIFVGRLCEEKDPIRFLNIITNIKKTNPNISVKILGDGPLADKVKKIVREQKLSNNVALMGFVKNPFPYLRAAKIQFFTSQFEGLPLAAVEGMLLGTPIIGTKVPGLKDLIPNQVGYLSNDDDVLIKYSLSLLNNKKEIIKKGMAARSYAKKLNDNKIFINKMICEFED